MTEKQRRVSKEGDNTNRKYKRSRHSLLSREMYQHLEVSKLKKWAFCSVKGVSRCLPVKWSLEIIMENFSAKFVIRKTDKMIEVFDNP